MSNDVSLRYLLFGEDKSATSTIGKVGGAFGKLGRQVGGEFGEILNKVGEGIDKIGEHAHSTGAKITGVGTIVAGVGVALQMAGSREAAGQHQLDAAIKASGHSAGDYREEIEKAIKGNEKFGFGAADTQQALTKLTAATNDPKKALENMGVVANLAASQHISLADASKMVARVLGGSGGRTLAQYGITMDKTKSKTVGGQIALDELAKKLDGQAAASVDSFGGKIKVLQTKIGDWTAQLGQKLGPALTIAGPAIMAVGTLIETGIIPAIGGAIASGAVWVAQTAVMLARAAVYVVVQGAAAVATGVWTAAQWALNAAMDANPVTLIIIGILALIAVIIVAWKHSQTFRTIVTGAFHAVVAAGQAAWNWIKTTWSKVGSVLSGAFRTGINAITTMWGREVAFWKGLPGKLGSALVNVASVLTSPFRSAFNAIADLWNGTVGRLSFKLPGWVPGMGGKGFSMPKLPHLASGGIVNRPTLLLAGEAGREAIVPLSAGRGGGGLGGNTYVEVNFNGLVTDPVGVATQLEQVLVKGQRGRGGRRYEFTTKG